jgi:hypothetical protein
VSPALLRLATRAVWADHGGGLTRDGGVGLGLGWLFLVGLVVVVALAGWALFAPAADEPDDETPGTRPPA